MTSPNEAHSEAMERAKDIVRYADTYEGPIPACYSWVAVVLARALVAQSASGHRATAEKPEFVQRRYSYCGATKEKE